ncbi:MAG: electron transfer flavoprotein subunit alpha [candidate division NC10 bacterium]|nr:electron transfer flavoprotein subunit alpha [candidate division NC10 bacterium]
METLLFLAHVESDGSLATQAREALGAAREMADALSGAPLHVGVVGRDVAAAAGSIAGCGAARFLGVAGADFSQPRYASDAAAAEALCKAAAATVVIAPATSRWCRVLPGVAQRVGGRVDTHVTGISADGGAPSVTRWYYRQRMEATLTRAHRPWIIVLDPGCGAPWKGEAGAATVEVVPVKLSETCRRTTVTGVQAPPADQQTIRPDAGLLFVAGAGWTKTQPDGKVHAAEAAELILEFLRKAQASLGGSKSLVDLTGEGQAVLPFMTHLNQIGQTGATPRHPKGLSACCHGEEPHVVGWRFISERRAINLDPNCGWARGKADVLYVADAFAVLRRVNALLGEK